jgi:hypothetical protein
MLRLPDKLVVRKAWRLIVLTGTFLLLVYLGLSEVQGENSVAAWLIVAGALGICLFWSRVWPEPERDG